MSDLLKALAARKAKFHVNSHSSAAVLSLFAIGLTGCGGGGGSNVVSNTQSGTAVKGPLDGALVFIDLDGDGELDSGELSTTTGSDGSYSFSTADETLLDGQIVVQTNENTVDRSSGEVVNGLTLSAPQDSDVVSPLTTLINDLVKTGAATDAGTAQTQVKAALGITTNEDLTAFNPFTATDTTAAKEVEKVAQQIVAVANSIAEAGAAAGGDKSELLSDALAQVVSQVSRAASNSNTVDLTDATTVTSIVQAVDSSLDASRALAGAIANVNNEIDQALSGTDSTLESARETFAVAQGLLSDAAAQVGAGDTSKAALLGSASADFDQIIANNVKVTGTVAKSTNESGDTVVLTGQLSIEDPNDDDEITFKFAERTVGDESSDSVFVLEEDGSWTYTYRNADAMDALQQTSARPGFTSESGLTVDGTTFQIAERFTVGIMKVDNSGDTEVVSAVSLDGGTTPLTKVITVAVKGVNDAPVVVADGIADATVNEDDSEVSIDVSSSFIDVEAIAGNDALTYSATGLPSGLSIDANTGVISGTPDGDNVLGAAEVTVTATDLLGASASSTFTLTVVNANDPVEVVQGANTVFTADEDVAFSGTVAGLFSDQDIAQGVEGAGLSYMKQSGPSWLVIDSGTGEMSGTPANGDVGEFEFSVMATDGPTDQAVSGTITVRNVNDAPTASDIQSSPIGNQSTLLVDLNFLGNNVGDIDAGDTVSLDSVTVTSGPATVAQVEGGFLVTPIANESGDLTLAYTVRDDDGATASGTVELEIVDSFPLATGVSEDPAAPIELNFDSLGLAQGVTVTGVQLTDSNAGTVAASSSGFAYTPAENFNGTAEFTITLSGENGELPGSVEVAAVNDAPAAPALSSTTVAEGELVVGQLTSTDVDADVLTFAVSDTSGLFSVNESNQLVFKQPADYEAGTSTFSVGVVASDGDLDSDESVFTVTLTDVDDTAPSITAETPRLLNNTLTGDSVADLTATDPDSMAISYSLTGATSSLDEDFSIDGNEFESAWFAVDESSGEITTTVSRLPQATYELEVTATDEAGNAASSSVVLNSAPIVIEWGDFGLDATRALVNPHIRPDASTLIDPLAAIFDVFIGLDDGQDSRIFQSLSDQSDLIRVDYDMSGDLIDSATLTYIGGQQESTIARLSNIGMPISDIEHFSDQFLTPVFIDNGEDIASQPVTSLVNVSYKNTLAGSNDEFVNLGGVLQWKMEGSDADEVFNVDVKELKIETPFSNATDFATLKGDQFIGDVVLGSGNDTLVIHMDGIDNALGDISINGFDTANDLVTIKGPGGAGALSINDFVVALVTEGDRTAVTLEYDSNNDGEISDLESDSGLYVFNGLQSVGDLVGVITFESTPVALGATVSELEGAVISSSDYADLASWQQAEFNEVAFGPSTFYQQNDRPNDYSVTLSLDADHLPTEFNMDSILGVRYEIDFLADGQPLSSSALEQLDDSDDVLIAADGNASTGPYVVFDQLIEKNFAENIVVPEPSDFAGDASLVNNVWSATLTSLDPFVTSQESIVLEGTRAVTTNVPRVDSNGNPVLDANNQQIIDVVTTNVPYRNVVAGTDPEDSEVVGPVTNEVDLATLSFMVDEEVTSLQMVVNMEVTQAGFDGGPSDYFELPQLVIDIV